MILPSEARGRSLNWFRQAAKKIEVIEANPVRRENERWGVWVTSGQGGHGWGGSLMAWAVTLGEAELIAHALRLLMEVMDDMPECICGYVALDDRDLDGHIYYMLEGTDPPSGSTEHRAR